MNKLMKAHELFNKHKWMLYSERRNLIVYHCRCGLFKLFDTAWEQKVIQN